MSGEQGHSPFSSDATLTEALDELKRRGSNLLVVGAVTADATARACCRMLGDAEPAERQRLLVFTDADGRRATDRLPGHGGATAGESVTLIDHCEASRSTVAAGRAGGQSAPAHAPTGPSMGEAVPDVVDRIEVDATDLVELGTVVTETIESIAADADGLSPAELRLCLDSLLPLLEANGREPVFRFLHVLTSHVRSHSGMAHFHLPVDPSAEEVHVLAPLFDAVVELRIENGTTQQRWHVPDADLSTDWLEI